MVMAMFQFQEFRSTLFLLIWVDQAYCEEFLKVLVFRATPKATSMHHIHACMQQLIHCEVCLNMYNVFMGWCIYYVYIIELKQVCNAIS